VKTQNPTTKAVLELFKPRFVRFGRVVWVSDYDTLPGYASSNTIAKLGLPLASCGAFPNVVIADSSRRLLVLIDVAGNLGQIKTDRRKLLTETFRNANCAVVLVNAFASRRVLQELLV
jgi:hypothetical protein